MPGCHLTFCCDLTVNVCAKCKIRSSAGNVTAQNDHQVLFHRHPFGSRHRHEQDWHMTSLWFWADISGCAGRHGSRGAERDRHQRLWSQTQTHQGHREAAGWPARSGNTHTHIHNMVHSCYVEIILANMFVFRCTWWAFGDISCQSICKNVNEWIFLEKVEGFYCWQVALENVLPVFLWNSSNF